MGRLEERISKLEAHAEAAQITEEARQQREWAEVLSRLSLEELSALDEVLDLITERWEDSGTFEDLLVVVVDRGLRATARYAEVLEAVRREVAL